MKSLYELDLIPNMSSETHTPPWVGSRSPDGWDQIPRWAGGWVLHQPPWSFGFDSQTRGTRENRAPPCVRVPGSSRVPAPPPPFTQSPYPPRSLVRDGQTHPHRPRLVVSHSTCPPLSSSPHAHSFVIGPAVIKHTHTHTHTCTSEVRAESVRRRRRRRRRLIQ